MQRSCPRNHHHTVGLKFTSRSIIARCCTVEPSSKCQKCPWMKYQDGGRCTIPSAGNLSPWSSNTTASMSYLNRLSIFLKPEKTCSSKHKGKKGLNVVSIWSLKNVSGKVIYEKPYYYQSMTWKEKESCITTVCRYRQLKPYNNKKCHIHNCSLQALNSGIENDLGATYQHARNQIPKFLIQKRSETCTEIMYKNIRPSIRDPIN